MNKKVKYISVDEVVKRYVDAKKPPTTEKEIRNCKRGIRVGIFYGSLSLFTVIGGQAGWGSKMYYDLPLWFRFAVGTMALINAFVCVYYSINLYNKIQRLKRQQLLDELLSDKK